MGVYAYALWILLWAVVWFGGFPAAQAIAFKFGGLSMSSNVHVYEGGHAHYATALAHLTRAGSKDINHDAKGVVEIPAFTWTPFASTVDQAATSCA